MIKCGSLIVGVKENADPRLNLRGPENDVHNFCHNILDTFFPSAQLTLLNSDATYENILDGLEWLAWYDAKIFYFSGHGSFLPRGEKEEDGRTEVLIPYDHTWDRPLVDDLIHERLTPTTYCIFDCCHASGMTKESCPEWTNYKFINPPEDLTWKKATKVCPRGVYELAACRSDELSMEKILEERWQGVFTWALSWAFRHRRFWSLPDLQAIVRSFVQDLAPNQHPTFKPLEKRILGTP